MLSSTAEYLQALRSGNYFLFLEWPQFIVQHYKKSISDVHNGDDLVDLMIFEWINNEFCEDDAKLIAFLIRLNDTTSTRLPGELEYALTSISVAVLQCMIYCSLDLAHNIQCKEGKNHKEVLALMNANSIEADIQESTLQKQHTQLTQWIDLVPHGQVDAALKKITPLIHFRQILRGYFDVLERASVAKDELRLTRLSVLHRLHTYLCQQAELSSQVRQEIDAYVRKISELAPQKVEEPFLLELSSTPMLHTSWRVLMDLGFSFFQLLKPVVVEEKTFLTSERAKSVVRD